METQFNQFPRSLMWITGIATILICTAGIVPITGWFHSSPEGSDDISAQGSVPDTTVAAFAPSGAGEARVKARCDECGVIESMRRIAPVGQLPAMYEITIRMGDGSTDVLSDARPANWRPGERIKLIRGGISSGI